MSDASPHHSASFQPEVKVDVDAIREAAYEEGYARGIGDLVSRLRVLEIFTQEDHGGCLQLILSTADTLTHTA